MKTFQRWLGILLVSIAAAGLMVACGDDAETCIEDGDCATGNLCNFETETCAVECTNDTGACAAGEEVCVERGAGNTGAICVSTGGGTDPQCTTDDDCTGTDVCVAEVCVPDSNGGACTTDDECTGEDVCVNETCVPPATDSHLFARILDVSTTCDADSKDPGSDIFGVELAKAGGETYYATVVSDDLVGDNNEHTDTTIIDGNAPALNGQCPENFTGSVVALGCGGSLVVSFINPTDSTPVNIENGDAITVMEWGATCTNGDASDQWEVQVCDSTVGQGDLIGSVDACNGTTAGSGSGISTVSVSF